MKEKTISIKSLINRTDYNSLRNYFMFRKKPKRTRILVLSLLGSLALLVINDSSFTIPFLKILGLVGFLSVAMSYYLITRDARNLEENIKAMVGKQQELSFSDNGFSVKWTGQDQAAEYDWDAIEFAVETDTHFYFFIEKHYALMLPKLELQDWTLIDTRKFIKIHIDLVSDKSEFKVKGV